MLGNVVNKHAMAHKASLRTTGVSSVKKCMRKGNSLVNLLLLFRRGRSDRNIVMIFIFELVRVQCRARLQRKLTINNAKT